ncbi:hypothetical protein H6P81_013989 [Aristolochia fimbriata]|uniref:RING-CH-type domain-containing protein n=1 Tax=Aristolochia fimbriata TaxID=158543 RepID=A0AAV7EHF5_ARIFI|nr:hypothetical protein H6P81_013989 [Aristolochia fimbriata]
MDSETKGESTGNKSSTVSLETAIEVKPSGTEGNEILKDRESDDVAENSLVTVAPDTVIEVRSGETMCSDAEEDKDSVSKTKPVVSDKSKLSCKELRVNAVEPLQETCIVVEAKKTCGSGKAGSWDNERVCRICHLSSDNRPDNSDLIQLGCGCKDELGIAHRHCAETWFKVKGNRFCEICGEAATNITGLGDQRFMEDWNERRILGRETNSSSNERGRCWRGQPFCNFLMACLVIAFILPWFFRINMF